WQHRHYRHYRYHQHPTTHPSPTSTPRGQKHPPPPQPLDPETSTKGASTSRQTRRRAGRSGTTSRAEAGTRRRGPAGQQQGERLQGNRAGANTGKPDLSPPRGKKKPRPTTGPRGKNRRGAKESALRNK